MDLMYGGCSAMSWTSEDGKHFFGRNFDFNRFADGSGVVFLPQGTPVCAFVREGETHGEAYPAKYASFGMGTLAIPGAPVLYDGMNEAGLAGGQLYFRGFARYGHIPRRGTAPVQAGLALPYILSQCATCEEAARELMSGVTIVQEPLFGAVPPLHWCFSDRTQSAQLCASAQSGLCGSDRVRKGVRAMLFGQRRAGHPRRLVFPLAFCAAVFFKGACRARARGRGGDHESVPSVCERGVPPRRGARKRFFGRDGTR